MGEKEENGGKGRKINLVIIGLLKNSNIQLIWSNTLKKVKPYLKLLYNAINWLCLAVFAHCFIFQNNLPTCHNFG